MELIKIKTSTGGKTIVDARDVYNFLCVETQFSTWIKRMFDYGFKENIDYSKMVADNEQVNISFALTLEMAKHVCMIQRTEKGMEARNYFIECEKKAIQQSQIQLPKTYLEAILALGESLKASEADKKLLAEQAPKVEFFDQVSQSTSEVSISEASKLLCLPYGSITLFKKLRAAGVLMHDNIPYQNYISNGWFRVVEIKYLKKDNTWGIGLKTVVYQKGLDGIRKLLSK